MPAPRTRLPYDPHTPPPCDSCAMAKACAEHRLACPAMVEFTGYGHTQRTPTVPIRECYDALNGDNGLETIRAYKAHRRLEIRAHKARSAG